MAPMFSHSTHRSWEYRGPHQLTCQSKNNALKVFNSLLQQKRYAAVSERDEAKLKTTVAKLPNQGMDRFKYEQSVVGEIGSKDAQRDRSGLSIRY